ncbi:MAG: ketoacyl-ACP synthase III [Spirochaetaceae bacterium]|jgi:3-oxoacyl-[acyl-carrier-protein] synthase-3|nr:ketoacyl-ACP synthase III [Spirochaetaceae bacterium]
MNARITGTGHYLPGSPIHNDDLPKELDTSHEWIHSHTGITNRHWASPEEACSDLALKASLKALENANCKAEEIDLILFSTVTPDFISFPASATLLQDKLGAPQAAAMDLNAACSGFVYALETAYAFIKAERYKKILVVGSEMLSRIVDWNDRSTCVLFGDGAGAVVVEADEKASPWFSALNARGKDAMALTRLQGGTLNPYKSGDVVDHGHFLAMDGKKVYLFAVSVLGETIQNLLKQSGLTVEDIDYIVPHQANSRIIEAVAARNKIPMEKFVLTIEDTGNTSSASIPIALDILIQKGEVKPGQRILLVGFGAGLTYGGTLLQW